MFKVKDLVIHFYLVKLRVHFEFAMVDLNQSFGITKILFTKNFKLGLK